MSSKSFSIQGSELVNGIYLLSSALVHFPALRDMGYAQASLIHDSAAASSTSEKECKSLRSTASPPKDTVTAKTEGDHAWENSCWAEHSTSSCGTQRLLVKAWLRKPTEMLQWTHWLFLVGHLNNSSKKQNFTNQKDLKTSATPKERRWEACLVRIFVWLVKVTISAVQWKFAVLSAYTS